MPTGFTEIDYKTNIFLWHAVKTGLGLTEIDYKTNYFFVLNWVFTEID